MLYIFNSAYREKYSTNLLNTFFLNPNSVNEYRYSTINVDPRLYDGTNRVLDKRALILFIDRHAEGGFVFHPIRWASYIRHEVRGDQVYFRLELEDFIYPKRVAAFQTAIRNCFDEKSLPHLSSAGPDSRADGYFALTGNDALTGNECWVDDQAWVNAVEAVAKTRTFIGKKTVFVRESIRELDGKQELQKIAAKGSYYSLVRGKRYTLQLYYRFPHQDSDRDASAKLCVKLPNLLLPLGPTEIKVNSRNSTEYIDFLVVDFPEQKDGIITLTQCDEDTHGHLGALIPSAWLALRSRKSWSFWPIAALLLLFYAILGICTGTDFDKLLAPLNSAQGLTTMQEFEKRLLTFAQDYWLFVKGVGALVQALVLFGLVKLLGKKLE